MPDAISLLRFRHLLEQLKLGEQLLAEASRVLQESGMTLKTATTVDAAIIAAPSSTKNVDGKRDPESGLSSSPFLIMCMVSIPGGRMRAPFAPSA